MTAKLRQNAAERRKMLHLRRSKSHQLGPFAGKIAAFRSWHAACNVRSQGEEANVMFVIKSSLALHFRLILVAGSDRGK